MTKVGEKDERDQESDEIPQPVCVCEWVKCVYAYMCVYMCYMYVSCACVSV